ncbi:MAG: hypothetical protein M1812_006442 [Candelaria pacifica]|nr:MAG: hypothetical protein M1812_006442 [Candelaria pacifica]
MTLAFSSLLLWLPPLSQIFCSADEATAVLNGPQDCCALLTQNSSSAVFYPTSSQYSSTNNLYWASQARLTPTCVFRPPSAEDAADAVSELAARSCQFAVKGGGYTAWAGAANIEDGVTIDLGNISNIQLDKDRMVAFISAGAFWSDVFKFLASQDVAIAAGMSASSGVGGLILGGELSLTVLRASMVLIGVNSVILANGTLVNANAQENPDLYGVLKGGSNNFGIVVRFDLRIFEQGDLWGGLVTYPNSTTTQHVNALVAFTDNIIHDPKGSVTSTWVYNEASGQTNVVNSYAYAEAEAYPAVFLNFRGINPVIADTTRIDSLFGLAEELQGSNNTRDLLATLTFANDAVVMSQVVNLSDVVVQTVKDKQDLVWSFHLQPLPRVITDHSVANGGNMLGLDRTQGNLILFILEIAWSRPEDDASITNAANALLAEITAYTEIVEKDNDFIYLNYALDSQRPFEGYGSANIGKMRSVSKNYDPDGVWQKLVKGGFKLPDM